MNNQKNPSNFTPRTSNNSNYNRKRKPNKDGIITLCFIALIAIIIVVLIIFLVRAIANKQPPVVPTGSSEVTISTNQTTPSSTDSTTGTTPTTPTSGTTGTTGTEPIVIPGYISTQVHTFRYNQGPLAVINSSHPNVVNTNSTLLSLYNQDGFNSVYRLFNSHISLQSSIVKNFTDMMKALKNAGFLNAGEIYLVKYAAFPTDPWHSNAADNENIAGYSFDLRVRLTSGLEAPLSDDEANWIKLNAANYGFVLRYQEGKEKITGEDYDSSHLRYVGIIHAKYMNTHNLSLEEYVDYLRTSTSYNGSQIKVNDSIVYYVPAGAGDMTTLYVSDQYTIDSYSGDNIGGFIVTATKK